MTLDKLYSVLKQARYPIRSRDELRRALGKTKIQFEGHVMDAEEISVHISFYPIHSVSEFFRDFLHEESEAYNLEEARDLGKFEARFEQ